MEIITALLMENPNQYAYFLRGDDMLAITITLLLCSDFEISRSSYYDGVKYTFTVNDKIYNKMPDWQSKDESPPVSARKAIQIGNAVLDRLKINKNAMVWELDCVILKCAYNKWFWIVVYNRNKHQTDDIGNSKQFSVFVLMDGTAVEPVKELLKK